ncbi:suppressor of fused domain protein [Actinosynnema sp. NPDC047251]|uniref:Suppressor of fused-like domain-containing protein n=1 Tax=Saccharothrix espanaensis (strain ATCC 51144 / DSM 44229 / JCM 9112 / NBRC 15066 / NRRL 15764) TaxID=1179773 RepID=K0K8T0_SACES|nr:suppressor of fused domain protein [Saccharothrix espanaensis]CCH33244.1 hypothetical protein BN6_59880 [Saccharothrix espanaensis DSM 44229]
MNDIPPGWAALDAALAARYPGIEPRHVAFLPPPAFDQVPGLQGCSAFPAAGHWHYVTHGLSELAEAGPEDDPEWSGWGFELTFRLARGTEETAPGWPFDLLQWLARYVSGERKLLAAGDHVDLRAPLAEGTALTGFALVVDPELGRIDTVNGKVEFLQLVGVTPAELALIVRTGVDAVLTDRAPLLVTDLSWRG